MGTLFVVCEDYDIKSDYETVHGAVSSGALISS